MKRVPDPLPREAFAAALVAIGVFGSSSLQALLGRSSPEALWRAVLTGVHDDARHRRSRKAGELDVGALWRDHLEAAVEVVLPGAGGFPPVLIGDPDGPAVLFRCGKGGALTTGPRVAVVGTRRATRYGLSLAAELGSELAAAGVEVVTGLTPGIDEAAHEGALAGSGIAGGAPPVGLVAGPLDRPDPTMGRLWERARTAGVLVSEMAVGRRAVPPWRFVRRNRMLGALADVVVVVEAHGRGRALATAQAAAQRGVTVGAVPGSVRSPASAGTNGLLADGAQVVRETADVLVALELARAGESRRERATTPKAARRRTPGSVTTGTVTDRAPARGVPEPVSGGEVRRGSDDDRVLQALEWEPCPLEEVLRRTGLGLSSASAALERLRAAGRAHGDAGWWQQGPIGRRPLG